MNDERLLGLHWGIKASFLDYVSRTRDGRASLHDGVALTDGNILVFDHDPETVDPDSEDSSSFFAFAGDLRFTAHLGMMFVRIARPWIRLVGDHAEMTVLDSAGPDEARILLAKFRLEHQHTDDGLRIWLATEVRLAAEGAALFNDVYPAGEPLEPLAIILSPPPRGTGTTDTYSAGAL